MGDDRNKQRKRTAMDLVARVEEILRKWDPIGVQPGELAPADEYDSYAPHIVSMVARGCSREQLRAHLAALRPGITGLDGDHETDWEIAGDIISAIR